MGDLIEDENNIGELGDMFLLMKHQNSQIDACVKLFEEVRLMLNYLPNQYYRGKLFNKTYDLASSIDILLKQHTNDTNSG